MSSYMSNVTRRQFLVGGLGSIGGVCGSLTISRMEDTTEDLELVRQTVEIEKLPVDFDGFKIGFISDIHLGIGLSEELLYRAFELLHKQQADLLLMGGDYIWMPPMRLARMLPVIRNKRYFRPSYRLVENIFDDLANLVERYIPSEGCLGVLGNHDNRFGGPLCIRTFGKRDIRILKNEVEVITRGNKRLAVVGVDDYLTAFPKFPIKKLNNVNPDTTILLAHNPDYVGDLASRTKLSVDLALCGHTHGGQIRLPFTKIAPYCNIYHTELIEGLSKSSRIDCYTSKGLGIVQVPYRIACKPDVTLLTLRTLNKSMAKPMESMARIYGATR